MFALRESHPPHLSIRNACLDGVRGYAALAVLVFHSILFLDHSLVTDIVDAPFYQVNGNYYTITKLFLTIFNGHTAVYLFFVLSGWVLFSSLLRAQEQSSSITQICFGFSVRRVARIYLPLIFCLLIFYVVFNGLHAYLPTMYPPINLTALIQNCLLYKMTIHGASWTLRSEILAIPFILFTFFMYKKFGIKMLILLSALSILILENDFKLNFYQINTWLYYFYLGFWCAIFPEELKFVVVKIGWILPLFLLIFVRHFFLPSNIPANLIQGICIAMFILYLSAQVEDKCAAFFMLPFSQYLGKISFSLYLWNVLILNLFSPVTQFRLVSSHPLECGLIMALLIFMITLPLAHLSEKWIEQPSIKIGKHLSTKIIIMMSALFSKKWGEVKSISTSLLKNSAVYKSKSIPIVPKL